MVMGANPFGGLLPCNQPSAFTYGLPDPFTMSGSLRMPQGEARPAPEKTRAPTPLLQLLLREALNSCICEDVLNRLCNGDTLQPFSCDSIAALRLQLNVNIVADLVALDKVCIAHLQGVSEYEKIRLVELCETMQRELSFFNNAHQPLLVHKAFPRCDKKVPEAADKRLPKETKRPRSAPPKLSQPLFLTKWPEHEAKHLRRECRPCAYYFKADSCKWGAQCDFCHLCPKDEIKVRKKEKIRAVRMQQKLAIGICMPPHTGEQQNSSQPHKDQTNDCLSAAL